MPKHHKPLPPLELLRELFRYDPESGGLIRIKTTAPNAKIGTVISGNRRNGYMEVWVTVDKQKQRFQAHRICWFMHCEKDPGPMFIDHYDRNRQNNKIDNLRLCSHGQNMCNVKIPSDNTSGAKGVCWNRDRGKWEWYLHLNGKCLRRARADTYEEAVKLSREAREQLHGEFHRHS